MVDDLAVVYAGSSAARISTSMIPFVGGFVDVVLCDRANRQESIRVQKVLQSISQRLDRMSSMSVDINSEEYIDYLFDTLDKSKKARTSQKIERFAQAFATQCTLEDSCWDDAFMVNRLIDELEDIHVDILMQTAYVEPIVVGNGEDEEPTRIVAIDNHGYEHIPLLFDRLTGYTYESIRLGCYDLVARGLLRDDGSNRAGRFTMDWLSPSRLTDWFIERIREVSKCS